MSHMNPNTTDDGRLRMAQELLDFILDHLHYDQESLKRCALASRSLLPTCQRHLFSTYHITRMNVAKLVEFFTLPASTDGQDECAALRARVADLFNAYTDNLILTDHPGLLLRSGQQARLPEFKSAQKITFRGDELSSAVTIPSFLRQTWMSPFSKIQSVEFEFRFMSPRGVLESLCVLPAQVENVGFIGTRPKSIDKSPTAASIRQFVKGRSLSDYLDREAREFNGTLKLRLPTYIPEKVLSVALELEDCFKFSLKRINYKLSLNAEIPYLASLVEKCKATLEFLDIMVSFPSAYGVQPNVSSLISGYTVGVDEFPHSVLRHYGRSRGEDRTFDFSHHPALKSIRIWIPADFDSDWLSGAISTIPKPSSATPRVPPLRIELHISLPPWMMYPKDPGPHTSEEVDELVAAWIPIDTQLSRLIGFSPDTLSASATSAKDNTTGGILLDITIPEVATGPGEGVAALMLPLLSDIKGLVRLG